MTGLRAPAKPPGRGSTFVAIAVTAFATGPCLLASFALMDLLFGSGTAFRDEMTIAQVPIFIGAVSLGALFVSIPAACLNAYILGRAARNGLDAPWLSLLSGALMGIIALLVVALPMGRLDLPQLSDTMKILGWFGGSGACMGALHWLIAIRPRRAWRKRLVYDAEAIRAME